MGFSPDVLVATLQEVLPGYTETFTTFHPAFEAIIAKGQKRKANGPWIEFGLVPGAPGQVTTLRSGTEVIAGGRRQDAERANASAASMIMPSVIERASHNIAPAPRPGKMNALLP